jgi:L-amino acid N-acyltransferase YncA
MNATIRPATVPDLAAINDIYNDAVVNTTASYDLEPRTIDDSVAWFHEHLSHQLPVLVAEQGGTVVGWGSLSHFHSRAGFRFTVEDSVYIAEECRGRGIGKQLLAALIDIARDRSIHAIVAGIDAECGASLRLHASLGFEQVGHFKEVGRKFDRWLDVVFMELVLGRAT